MRYGIFGDLHGNLHALDAVLEAYENEGIDEYICTGDLVGYGAFPRECVDKTRALCRHVVAGNHDFAVCEKLTLEPWTMAEADVESLRTVGFDDVAILAIVQAAAYRNYITRVADALEVELTNAEYPEAILSAFPAQRAETHTPQAVRSPER